MADCELSVRYRVQFAGSNGKRRYVGTTERDGRTHYPMQADAAELFATFGEAERAADDIPVRYIVKRTLPIVKPVRVLTPIVEAPHGSLASAMRCS